MDESSSFLIDSSSGDESEIQGDDELGEKRKFEISRSADIYLIDAREPMFSQDCLIDNNSAFIQSLKSIRYVLRKKIWRMDNSLSAIILLGTKTDNQMNLNGINVLQPLKALSAEHILKCDEIIKKVEDSSFRKEYGLSDFSLADAFWLSSKTYSENVRNMRLYKTLVLFTNDDDPTNKDKHEFYRIIGIGRDMLQYKIVFNLVNLGKNFNANFLFKELIQLTNGDMDYQIPDPPKTFEEIVNQISSMDYTKLPSSSMPFYITAGFKCNVCVHYLVRRVKLPFKAKLSKATNDEVITRMEYFETETGEVVKKDNLVKCYRLAGRDIAFTMDEISHIKKFIWKGLRLMGFKPASTITLEHYMKPSVFISPSVNDLGSCSFFMALHRRCLERQVVPICTFCHRDRAELQYVALIAQAEETDENNRQLCPSGFHVFFLPSAEDVRDLNQECTGKNRAGPNEVELAKKLIKKLKFKYKPEKFTNPKLAAHWSAIEALALNLKEPEPFVDSTLPDYDLIRDRTKSVAEEFSKLVFPENYNPQTAPKKTSVSCSKQARPEPIVDIEGVERMLRDGQFQRLTNETLKLYLKKVGKGKDLSKERKAQLIERACKHLQIPPP